MTDHEDFPGDLPPLDPALAAWLARDPDPVMPAEVWDRIQARLAAEPALTPDGLPPVASLERARQRRRGGRVLPILAGAAGLALVGAVVLPSLNSPDPTPIVADGPATSQPMVAASADEVDPPTVTQNDPSATPLPAATPARPSGAAATTREPVMPRAMVATGTDYTDDALPGQVVTLLAAAGMSDSIGVASAMTASPAPTAMPGTGLAASPEALADCMTRLGMPAGAVPLVLDTAMIDGREGSVIVTAGQMSAEGVPASVHVVAVGQDCTDEDVAAARHWEIPLR